MSAATGPERQRIMHAAKTLRARADAVIPGSDGVLWCTAEAAGDLRHVIDVDEPLHAGDQAWLATMTPDVGRAVADLLDAYAATLPTGPFPPGLAYPVLYLALADAILQYREPEPTAAIWHGPMGFGASHRWLRGQFAGEVPA